MNDKKERIFLDYASSTPLRDEVREVMLPYLGEKFGNPSSNHFFGRELKLAINEARDRIADAMNCSHREIIFVSGATEGDNWALNGLAGIGKGKGRHFIISAIEHHAVMETAAYLEKEGFECTRINPKSDGVIQMEDVKAAIRPDTTFISLMTVNNELGTLQPVRDVAILAREHGLMVHTDCAQGLSTQFIDLQDLPVDILTATAHKIYGPIGSGFNFIRKGLKIEPFIRGGAHEYGLRAGTENVAGIIGLAKAVELTVNERKKRIRQYNELGIYLLDSLHREISGVELVGDREKRAPHIYYLRVPGIEAEDIIMGFDEARIAVSTGSACTSGCSAPSHVLIALGFDSTNAYGYIRISFGIYTLREHIDIFIDALKKIIKEAVQGKPA